MNNLKLKVQKHINEMSKFSENKWDIVIDPIISYDLDSTRALGQYSKCTDTISLNENLLNEFGNLYIEDVVVHEFCHAIINNLYPSGYKGNKKIQPHGKEFKAVCS